MDQEEGKRMAPKQTAFRPLPNINEMNRYFWCGGVDGFLRILRCDVCETYIHPYAARCPKCRSPDLAPQPVSGRGRVLSFTVNVQQWLPNVATPYVIAVVELEEQANLRLMTNLPRTPIEKVKHDLPVKVYFEQHGDIYVPLFEAA